MLAYGDVSTGVFAEFVITDGESFMNDDVLSQKITSVLVHIARGESAPRALLADLLALEMCGLSVSDHLKDLKGGEVLQRYRYFVLSQVAKHRYAFVHGSQAFSFFTQEQKLELLSNFRKVFRTKTVQDNIQEAGGILVFGGMCLTHEEVVFLPSVIQKMSGGAAAFWGNMKRKILLGREFFSLSPDAAQAYAS